MKVLHIATPTGASLGADTWVHAEIIKALDRDQHDIFVAWVPSTAAGPTPICNALSEVDDVSFISVAPGPNRRLRPTPVNLARSAVASVAAVWSVLRLIVFVWRKGIDIIHTSDRPRDALVSVVVGRLSRAQSVVHVHVLFRDWMSPQLRWAIRHADARIAVSEFVRQSLIEGGAPAETTHVVLNAIDIDRWHPGVGGEAIRAEFGIEDSAPVIVSVCRLFPEKGPADLIAAIEQVRRRIPDVRLLIVGEDSQPDEPYLQVLEALVHDLDLDDCVVFTGRRSDVPALMAAADVFAMPSFEEPFGLVFGEAMAMCLPVVALDNGGTTEVVQHGRNGLLSEPGDHEALVSNLVSLLEDQSQRDRLGQSGRQRVEDVFTVSRMAGDIASTYRRITS